MVEQSLQFKIKEKEDVYLQIGVKSDDKVIKKFYFELCYTINPKSLKKIIFYCNDNDLLKLYCNIFTIDILTNNHDSRDDIIKSCRKYKNKDLEKFTICVELGVDMGIPYCINQYGILCINNKDYDNAAKWFKLASNKGELISNFNLMCFYQYTQKDEVLSEFYYNLINNRKGNIYKEISKISRITYLHKIKNDLKAEEICLSLDDTNMYHLCIICHHYRIVGNNKLAHEYYQRAYDMFKVRKIPDISIIQKIIDIGVKKFGKFPKISDRTDKSFPIGLWWHHERIHHEHYHLFSKYKDVPRYKSITIPV